MQETVALGRHRARELSVRLAQCPTEILAAQKLRWRVFAEEMGARLNPHRPGVDQDLFDVHCEHLIVRDKQEGKIVGTSRILSTQSGGVISLLWAGLARYMLERGYSYLMGCASIGMADGRSQCQRVIRATGKPSSRRAVAWVCSEPARDPDFNTANLLMLLPISRNLLCATMMLHARSALRDAMRVRWSHTLLRRLGVPLQQTGTPECVFFGLSGKA